MTAVFPSGHRSRSFLRACLLCSLPPKNASSISAFLLRNCGGSFHASRMRCERNQAVRCVTRRSRLQLQGAYALQGRKVQVDRNSPLLKRDIGTSENRSSSNGKAVPAVSAPIRLGLPVRAFGNHAVTSATRTVDTLAPAYVLKPMLRCPVVGELLEQLYQGDTFPVVPSRPLG